MTQEAPRGSDEPSCAASEKRLTNARLDFKVLGDSGAYCGHAVGVAEVFGFDVLADECDGDVFAGVVGGGVGGVASVVGREDEEVGGF